MDSTSSVTPYQVREAQSRMQQLPERRRRQKRSDKFKQALAGEQEASAPTTPPRPDDGNIDVQA